MTTTLDFKHVMYWAVGGLALFVLAGPLPDLATMLAVLLIAGVLLTHAQDYINIVQGAAPAPAKK